MAATTEVTIQIHTDGGPPPAGHHGGPPPAGHHGDGGAPPPAESSAPPPAASSPPPASSSSSSSSSSGGSQSADEAKAKAAAAAAAASAALSGGFEKGLFDCCGEPLGFVLACCLPCFPIATAEAHVANRKVHILDYVCCCTNPYATRQAIRSKYGLKGNPYIDCFSAYCCGPCFIQQNCREIAHRSGKAPEYIVMPELGF